MIVFAAIAPHGAPVFDEPMGPTRRGMEELRRRFAVAAPEAAIVITPHGLLVDGAIGVVRSGRLAGDASAWTTADTRYDGPGDPALAAACLAALAEAGVPAAGLSFGSSLAEGSTFPLDWGASIPLRFMRAPAVVVTPSRALPNDLLVRAGAALEQATGTRRVALIASADHGHGHRLPDGREGPYGFSSESAGYDAWLQELVRGNRLGELVAADPALALAAKADSFWQLLMLHGAIGERFDPELISYEAPTYFGMLTASFTRED